MTSALAYIAGGVLVVLAAWIPVFVRGRPVSLPMVALAAGLLMPFLTAVQDPLVQYSAWVEHVAEFALLAAVFGAGLKIDRPFSIKGWDSTWRLLVIVMPLSIALIALAGWWLLGTSLSLALLVGGALAPTDPVLAASVQVGPPGKGEEGETKFALTSEAGLNDGMAFPFVMLGIALVAGDVSSVSDLIGWALVDFVWDVGVGAAVGIALGWFLSAVNIRLPQGLRLSASNSGLVAMGIAFLVFGLAEVVHGNGFIAVFCEAVTVRNLVAVSDYSRRLNHVAEQFESVAMVIVLTFFGISVSNGLLASIGWAELLFTAVVLLVIRPVATWIGFLHSAHDRTTRLAVGYFGIRGIGTIYYATYVAVEAADQPAHQLTAIVAPVVLVSVILYGMTTDFVAGRLLGRSAGD